MQHKLKSSIVGYLLIILLMGVGKTRGQGRGRGWGKYFSLQAHNLVLLTPIVLNYHQYFIFVAFIDIR